MPEPNGFPSEFRTCYKNKTSKTCYTIHEWKFSTEVTACALDNSDNEWNNKWYNKLDESTIAIISVGVFVLSGLFIAGYYGYRRVKQNQGVQNTENLL